MMSDKSLSIRVKIGNNEIELSGPAEEVSKALDDLPKIVSVVSIPSPLSSRHYCGFTEPRTTKQNGEEFPDHKCPDWNLMSRSSYMLYFRPSGDGRSREI